MTSNIPSDFNKQYPKLTGTQSNSGTYIPAMYQNSLDCYESSGKKTCRILKTVTSVFNSVLLTAGVIVGGIFGFKWLKNSNMSFMSKPLDKVKFTDDTPIPDAIKGNEKQKDKLKNIIDNCINTKKGCGVLLQGPPRCGKTLSANVYAKNSGLTTFSCKTSSIISPVRGQTEKNIDKMFEQLKDQVKKDGKPVILIMDEIDSFLIKRSNASNEENSMVAAFLRNCDNLASQGIIILGSTNYANKCDEAAVGSGRFNETISFELPKQEDFEMMLGGKVIAETPTSDGEANLRQIAQFMETHHMNFADAQNILDNCLGTDGKNIDYTKAMTYLISKCQGHSSIQISTLKSKSPTGKDTLAWNDIYGLDDQKQKLIDWAEEVKKGAKPGVTSESSGYLLSGPPGCGKTTIPYALGQELNTDVYSLHIGENGVTTDNISEIIKEIEIEGLRRKIAGEPPIILFMDEAEAMFPNRYGADLMHNVENSHQKTTTMLSAIQNLQNSGVLCIAATNHPESVDGGMKRNGRLNKLEIGMPDKQGVKKFIEKKYPNIEKDTSHSIDDIVNAFIEKGSDKSRLSIANITEILNTWTKPSSPDSESSSQPLEISNLERMVDKKENSMNSKPLESGLIQISKTLGEIYTAITELKDESAGAKIAELTTMLKKQLKPLNKLDKLDNLEGINKAITEIRTAIGDPVETDGGQKANLLQLLTTISNKLTNLEELKKLKEIQESLEGTMKQNGEVVKSFNNSIAALEATMQKIDKIAENNNSAILGFQDYIKSFASNLQQVGNALLKLDTTQGSLQEAIKNLGANQGLLNDAIGNLGTTQSALQTAIGQTNTLLEKLEKKIDSTSDKNDQNELQGLKDSFEKFAQSIDTSIKIFVNNYYATIAQHIAPDVLHKVYETLSNDTSKKNNFHQIVRNTLIQARYTTESSRYRTTSLFTHQSPVEWLLYIKNYIPKTHKLEPFFGYLYNPSCDKKPDFDKLELDEIMKNENDLNVLQILFKTSQYLLTSNQTSQKTISTLTDAISILKNMFQDDYELSDTDYIKIFKALQDSNITPDNLSLKEPNYTKIIDKIWDNNDSTNYDYLPNDENFENLKSIPKDIIKNILMQVIKKTIQKIYNQTKYKDTIQAALMDDTIDVLKKNFIAAFNTDK